MERAVGKRVAEILGVFPSFDSEQFGGIQATGWQAWESVKDRFGKDAQSLLYRNGDSKLAAVFSAARLPQARHILVWHLQLSKLLPLLAQSGSRVTVFLHGIEAWQKLPLLTRLALRRVDLFVSNTDFTWSKFIEFNPEFTLAPHRIVHLGLGSGLAETISPMDPPAALMIGRLHRRENYKGHREVIGAWPLVLERIPDAELWIAGDGTLRPELEQLAREVRVHDKIRFYGYISETEKERLIGNSRCLALPSAGEGFGLVYLEAMRMGRPCLVSTVDAGREVVNPPEAGLAVDTADSSAIACAVIRLLAAGHEWDRWSHQARCRYAAHFTGEHFRQRLLGCLID